MCSGSAKSAGQPVGHLEIDVNIGRQEDLQRGAGFGEEEAGVDSDEAGFAATGEGEELLHELGALVGRVDDLVDEGAGARRVGTFTAQGVDLVLDLEKHAIDVAGHVPGQCADSLQAPGLVQPLFQRGVQGPLPSFRARRGG